jgi:hypothetical protein
MRWLLRHYGKPMALAMMLVQVSGARIVNVIDPLAGSRTFFTAELGTKGYLAAATKRDWSKKRGPFVTAKRHSASDMDKVGKGGRVYPTPVLPLAGAVIAPPAARPGPLRTRRLPFEISPVQPPHLHTKK